MAESNVIKEFLVALGFKSDEAALKKFTSGIETATKSVAGLALAIEATAVTVAAGVARFASNLEALYFASLRTGASAVNLKALDKAAQNFGASAGQAVSAVESLSKFLRVNPGGEGMLRSLGIQTRDANNNLRDTTDLLVDMGKTFAKQPLYLANQYAEMFGIPYTVMLAMRNGDFGKEVDRQRKQLENSGLKKATEDAHRFMESLRDLEVYLWQFAVRVEDALQNRLGLSVRSFTDYLAKHGPELADKLVSAIQTLWNAAEKIKPAFQWIYDKLVDLDKSTDGWSTKILLVIGALKFMGGTEIIGGLLSLTASFVRLGAAIAGAAGSMTTLAGGAAVVSGVGLGWAIQKYVPGWADFFGKVGASFYDKGHQTDEAVSRWVNRGYTPAQAAGIVANEQAESNLRANAVGDNGAAYGAFQFHKPWQDKFRRWSGKDIQGSTLEEQEEFLNYELRHGDLQSLFTQLQGNRMDPAAAAAAMVRSFERPANMEAEAARRGANARVINQSINISIDGAQSPQATAAAVTGALRNLAVGVQ